MTKEIEYAMKMNDAIAEMFDTSSNNYIDPSELSDADNANAFFHALANIMPCRIFNKLTENDEDVLGFNHVANRLCFQFSDLKED